MSTTFKRFICCFIYIYFTFALPDVVDIFCNNNGNANSENKGVDAMHFLRFNLRSLAVIPYGLSGGGRNVIGK